MIEFSVTGQIADTATTELQGAADVALIVGADGWKLAVAAEANGAISVFDFAGAEIGQLLDHQGFSSTSGTRAAWNLTVFDAFGATVIAPATRYEDKTKLYALTAADSLNQADPGTGGQLGLSHAFTNSGGTYLYAHVPGQAGLSVFAVDAQLDLTLVATLTDTDQTCLGDVSAFASARVDGTDFLFVASAWDAGIASYKIHANGSLGARDMVLPSDGSGFARVSALETVAVDGKTFVVMAGAGTSSLTVFAVDGAGNLTEVEHLIDSLDTRFQNASELAVFSHDGRSFVVAAGSDDGISVLEIDGAGQLTHLGALADTYDTTLDNVSGIDVAVIDGTPVLVVSSPTDHGVTVIELTFQAPPSVIAGNEGNNYLRGSSDADVIEGNGGNDRIEGKSGADVLADGTGADMLEGGGGYDTFVFTPDATRDVIVDFQPGLDTIDLSGYAGVNSIFDTVIYDTCDGVMIHVGMDMLLIQNDGDTIYTAGDLSGQNLIF